MDDYDPGTPWNDDRPQRKSRRWDHPDDAWAAAEEDGAPPGDDLEIEDFAAGYVDDDPLEHGAHNPNRDDPRWAHHFSRDNARADYPGIDPESGFLPDPPRRSTPPRYVDDANFNTSRVPTRDQDRNQDRNQDRSQDRNQTPGTPGLQINERGMFQPPDTRSQPVYRANQPRTSDRHHDHHLDHDGFTPGGLPFLTVLILVILLIAALVVAILAVEWIVVLLG